MSAVRGGLPAALAVLREAKGGLLAMALLVGAVAGVGAIVFRWLIRTFAFLLSGHADYSAVSGRPGNPHVPWLGPWFVLLAPLTGEYSIILPLMTAIVLATGSSHALSHDIIYTLKLRRRGIDIDHTPPTAPLAGITVGAVMEPVPATLRETLPLADASGALARSPH